jgi:hypothetical protein
MVYSLENGKTCTIGTLFSENNKVVIPDMQREYCWAKTINPINGESLVFNYINDILDLYTKNKVIRMGLIYAYQAPQTFIQLCDGQQRITTLYLLLGLLHKRLLKDGNDYSKIIKRILISEFEEENDDREPRLQYAIRESTLWFTRDLVNEYFLKQDSRQIQNSPWYFEEYNLDPSIENMVSAISIIEKILEPLDSSIICGLAHFVVDKITFLYYDMGNRQYGEDQFVVINTTGVGLSNTENIKPKLIASITNITERETYSIKWEEEWEHFFWTHMRNPDSRDYTVDADFHEFLRWVFIIEKAGDGTLSSDKIKYTPAQKALDGEPFNIFDIAGGDGLSIARTIDEYFQAYQCIVEKHLYSEWLNIQRGQSGDIQSIPQIEALRFLPLLYFTKAYLQQAGNVEDISFLRNYKRLQQFMWGRSFSRNISRSTIETVPRAIEIAKRICHECGFDVVNYPQLDPSEGRFFTEGERKKYIIYKEHEKDGTDARIQFEDHIWAIEKLGCCLGNVTCLFDAFHAAGEDFRNLTIADLDLLHSILQQTFEKPSTPFRQALMTYGEYRMWSGSTPSLSAWKYSFGNNAAFFRNLFTNANEEKKRQILIAFLKDAYQWCKNGKDLAGLYADRIAKYASVVPNSRWEEMIKNLISDSTWLDKASLSLIAWDETQEISYILYKDRSPQGYEEMPLTLPKKKPVVV